MTLAIPYLFSSPTNIASLLPPPRLIEPYSRSDLIFHAFRPRTYEATLAYLIRRQGELTIHTDVYVIARNQVTKSKLRLWRATLLSPDALFFHHLALLPMRHALCSKRRSALF